MSHDKEKKGSSSGTNASANNISVTNRQLNVRPFQINENRTETASAWEKWLQNIERQFRYFGITEPEMKKDGLIIYGGQTIADLEDTLLDLTGDEAGEDEYSQLVKKLNKHFLPKKNKDFARFQFGNLKQNHGESLIRYYTRIREIAKKCNFSNESEAIRDHLIKTMTNNVLRIKAIRKNWTLDQILEEAELDEETRIQAKEMEMKVNSEETIKRVQNYRQRQRQQRPLSHNYHAQRPSSNREVTTIPCDRCGFDRAHKQCPAIGCLCNACGKRNHYAKVCRSKPMERSSRRSFEGRDKRETKQLPFGERRPRDREVAKYKNVKHVTNSRDRSSSTESSTSSDNDLVNHLKIYKTSKESKKSASPCVVYINGHKTLVEPDTGADSNIMDEIQFRELKNKSTKLHLYESKIKLNTLKEKLPVKGECNVTIENETRQTQVPLVIVEGKINSLPLIGRATLEELGMVKIDESGRLKEPNKPIQNIRKLQQTTPSVEEILEPYQDLFHGIGRATRNGEEIQLHLPMKEDAEPVAQKPRRVAYHLMDPLKKRLQEFVEQGIMEKVPDQEPITWCSPIVVQPKPKNPNDIRLSLDLRTLNKSMLRTRQVQAPITEDFITAFRDCSIFSKLDMNHGYHQFVIDPQSRQAMTFSTPWGNYRYTRLAFGGINSQDLFDNEMAKILSGIPKTLNNRDDIMIGGVDLADHDKNLKTVLEKLKDHNLTLRQEKCEFRKSTLEFHGHLFTAKGLKPSASKVDAVNACQKPNTKEELVSFLQMVAYLSRYIDRFSSRCEPLRRLTKENTKFQWGPEQQQAFDDLKAALTTAPVLIPYQPGRETLVIVDGSPEGLGGALLQKTTEGFQPVHYVSRTLTDTEKHYSQIEREALAAEFTTSRLQMYLLGAPKFKLVTDHKPLLPLLNNPKAKIPPRIERIIIKMQNLDFEAIHIPGKSNMTDYISRHPLPETGKHHIEKHVNAAIQADHAIVWSKIKRATEDDAELRELSETIETGNWSEAKQFLKPYYEVRDELFVADGVVMRMDRIVAPQSLRQRIIHSAHKQGHLGVNKTKEMIRRKYWFPGMNSSIEDAVQSCFDCQIATDHHHTEPAKMSPLPDRPWDVVEADFCGPLPNNKYALVLTDQYSRYPEVEMVTSTSTLPVTKKLKKIFSTHGVPRVLQTDNGPPFNGEQFQAFAKEMGFQHKRVTPIHPKAQGQVENFNKLINKTTKIACEEGIDIESAIYDMLQAYRQTPHPATKSAPYEVLMHRQVRTRLEHFPTEVHITQSEVKRNDEIYKQKRNSTTTDATE